MMEYLTPYHRVKAPIYGRDKECHFVLSLLNRRGGNRRVLLVGPTGVGKTTLIQKVVQHIQETDLPADLKKLRPYSVNLNQLIALLQVKDRISELPPIAEDMLLIINEFDLLFSFNDATTQKQGLHYTIISWFLTGDHPVIISATPTTYYGHLAQDLLLKDKLMPFHVTELSPTFIKKILVFQKKHLEKQYKQTIPDRIVDEILDFSDTLLKKYTFPQCGLELLEAVCSSATLRRKQNSEEQPGVVNTDDLYEQLSLLLRIPVGNYLGIDEKRVLQLKERIAAEIFGQERALGELVRAVQRALIGTKEPGHPHPLGIFLFMGPTGVGKTETARALSRHLFGEDQSLVINMAEFKDPIEGITRLRGAALAYQIQKNPFSVVILDEIEKSAPAIREFFLNIFDYGTFKDIHEQEIDASSTFFVMTSNVGSSLFEQAHGILPESFSDRDYKFKKIELLEALKKEDFRPEFINRIDDIILYKPLNRADIVQIIESNMRAYIQIIGETEGKQVTYDRGIIEILAKGCDLNFGARDARRIIRKNIYSLILKTEQYYQSEAIIITRNKYLRSLDSIMIAVCSTSPKDGISLILDLNKEKYNLRSVRLSDITQFDSALNSARFDIILLHSSLARDKVQRNSLDRAIGSLKKADHRAALFLVVDTLQPLSQFKSFVSQGVQRLLRVSEIEDWLEGIVAEIKQRKSLAQSVEFNYEDLVWSVHHDPEKKVLSLILEQFSESR